MAELNCAVCDKEVGFQGQIKLSDGNFICRDCEKKVSPFFEPSESTLETYKGNLKQNEEGKKLYDAYFSNNKKAVKLCDTRVIFDPGTALICIFGERGDIFSKKRFYNVFPLADLEKYELTSRFQKTAEGANSQVDCIYLSFAGEREGLSSFKIATDAVKAKRLIKEFDRALEENTTDSLRRADAAIREALKII